jgi:hypothetical protein
MVVFVNYGQYSRWYFVFAKNEDISQGYVSHQGPFTPPNRKRRDVLLNAKPGTRWCSQGREEAQQNRKGCLFGDQFVPFTAPGKDLFLEHVGPLADSDRIAQYVDSVKWGSFVTPSKPLENAIEQDRIITPSLTSLLDHNLSEYCSKVARSLAKSQRVAISWIWRSTKFKTNNEAVVHRTWKARALLFRQLEDHARKAPSTPCTLKFTTEIVELISGFLPSTALPHAQPPAPSDEEESQLSKASESAYMDHSRKGNGETNESTVVDGSSKSAVDFWPSSFVGFKPFKQFQLPRGSSTASEVDGLQESEKLPTRRSAKVETVGQKTTELQIESPSGQDAHSPKFRIRKHISNPVEEAG